MTTDPARPLLYVEDDEPVRSLTVALLEKRGFEIVAAADGQQAMDLLAAGFTPALIVMDLMMPILSGWDLWDWLQGHVTLRRVPVIVCTASGLSQGSIGHARVVQKGSPSVLLAAVDEMISVAAAR